LFIRFSRYRNRTVAFFHPYCDAGGGGEKVLWEAVRAIKEAHPDYSIFIYTGDDAAEDAILARAVSRFNLTLPDDIRLIKLKYRWLVEASTWPYFTLAGQSIGSIILALEAVIKLNPEIMIDSMGYSFTYPLFRLCGSKVGCYIHYPTISTDMLKKVKNRGDSFNNDSRIAKSTILTNAKLVYYKLFAWAYSLCGKCSQSVMTNSSWTANHINSLWNVDSKKIYPPCDVSRFSSIPLTSDRDPNLLISLAQFRPEKNHSDQVRAFSILKNNIPNRPIKFVMAGGVRNEGDEKRANDIEALASEYGLENDISVERNISFERMQQLFKTAQCAIHTMKDEHFGITCVEFKASGILTCAHNSAGPAQDILVPFENEPTGFLANDVEEFGEQLTKMFQMEKLERENMQRNAQKSNEIFSSKQFCNDFVEATSTLFL